MEAFQFQKAQAVWANGREEEKNCELAFRTVIPRENIPDINGSMGKNQQKTVLYLAASTLYRLWVNGTFVSAGPARTAHGYYCVDRLELTDLLTKEENVIVIEVVGYNVNSYDTLDQPSFLTAEVWIGDQIAAYTGGEGMQVYELGQRMQYVQRYSFQRGFAEAYRLAAGNRSFFTEPICHRVPESWSVQEEKRYVKRSVRMPQYEKLQASALLETGTADFTYVCPNPIRDRSYLNIGEQLKGYRPEELEVHLSEEGQNIQFKPDLRIQCGADPFIDQRCSAPESSNGSSLELRKYFPLELRDSYGIYSFPFNATGFLRLTVQCKEACTIYLLFDEILSQGRVDFLRLTSCNCFKYELDPGMHEIMTFAPYTMKYVQVAAKGSAVLTALDLVEYKHPPVAYEVNLPQEDGLWLIYQAALESFLANGVDAFSDCPSRERADWLCDSFFTARVEHVLTGESVLEQVFLENFLLAESFPHLPKGMLPMCYPADHNDGNFIPNWAMWFVLELEEYEKRTQDRELVDRAKTRVYELLEYFEAFENEYGLLENLERWVFVEWSRANDPDVVQDVNFPSNMLYGKMLQAASRLYQDDRLAQKAKKLRTVIRERSLRGVFYTDNECRTSNGYINPQNRTEVCQYYAFFTGVATKQEDAELWEILCRDFGYKRKETGLHPEVAFANAFIGNYLRIELLYQDGQYEEVVDNIRGYFMKMARQTGTLWEHDSPHASCNHGFASHVIYWLAGIFQTHLL